jgi:hypothetical protein
MVNVVVGPNVPYGASNWPGGEEASIRHREAPTRERPDSPWVIRTVRAYPARMAATACRTCSRNEVPPTPVPSIQSGVIPRACATWTGPGEATVAMPSMSRSDRPASATAFSAPSICSCRVEWPGSLPSRSVSAAPAIIQLPPMLAVLPPLISSPPDRTPAG